MRYPFGHYQLRIQQVLVRCAAPQEAGSASVVPCRQRELSVAYSLTSGASVADTPRTHEALTKIKATPIANTLGPVRGIASACEIEKARQAAVAFILEPLDAKMASALVQQ